MTIHNGIVKWFSVKDRYGFIRPAPALKLQLGIPMERDLYFHEDSIMGEAKALNTDDRVEFSVHRDSRQRPLAINVRLWGTSPTKVEHKKD